MESLKACGSTWRLTGLPFPSRVSVASPWHARHSSTAGFRGCDWPAATSEPALKRRVRATPGAKSFWIVRVDMLTPADTLELTISCGSEAAFVTDYFPTLECRRPGP